MIKSTIVAVAILLIGGAGCGAMADAGASIAAPISAPFDAQAAAREIASVAAQRSVVWLGHPGGFYRTPEFHIPLPKTLDGPVDILRKNFAPLLPVAVEKAINQAAEEAVPVAGDYVLKTVPGMSFVQPGQLLQGPDDAVTSAIKAQTAAGLREALRPFVRANLAHADAPAALDRMQARYEQLTNAAMPSFDIESYTLDSVIAGFFARMAEEEQYIRERPSARSTDTLKRLFTKQ